MPSPFPFSVAEKIALFHAAQSHAAGNYTQLKAAALAAERSGEPIGEMLKTVDLLGIHQDKKTGLPLLSIDPVWARVPGHPGVHYLSYVAPMGSIRTLPESIMLGIWTATDGNDVFGARRLRPQPTIAIENETWVYEKPGETKGHLRGTLFASQTAEQMTAFLASRPSLQPSLDLAFGMAYGDLDRMRKAVAEGADLLRLYGGRDTALHVAAGYTRPEQAALLLELGADPDIKDVDGRLPEQHPKIDAATVQVFSAWRARKAMDTVVQQAKAGRSTLP